MGDTSRRDRGNASYTSRQIINEFLLCLARVVEDQKVQQLKSSCFYMYSLLIDESTDVAVLKQLRVAIQCVLPSGVLETMIQDNCDLQDGTASIIEHTLYM